MIGADSMPASGRRSNEAMAPYGALRVRPARATRRCLLRTRVSESCSDRWLPEIPRCSSRPVDRWRMLSCEIPIADDMAAMWAVQLCRVRSAGARWLFFLARSYDRWTWRDEFLSFLARTTLHRPP